MLAAVALSDDVGRIAAAAAAYTASAEVVAAVLPVELHTGERLYLCAFAADETPPSWLVLDAEGRPVTSRDRIRDAASIAAMVEVAEDSANVASDEPRLASLAYLDSLGATAVQNGNLVAAMPAVEELARDVETNYKLELT
jgi:hypothetical protein